MRGGNQYGGGGNRPAPYQGMKNEGESKLAILIGGGMRTKCAVRENHSTCENLNDFVLISNVLVKVGDTLAPDPLVEVVEEWEEDTIEDFRLEMTI